MEGALLIALEKDRFWKDGNAPSPGAWAFVAGIGYATKTMAAQRIGNPPTCYETAPRALGIRPDETKMSRTISSVISEGARLVVSPGSLWRPGNTILQPSGS